MAKKICVVASGWHFPLHFYEMMAKQKMPTAWEMDLFCISHRDPSYATEEHKQWAFNDDLRGRLDAKLYEKTATVEDIVALGWGYQETPNTVGDWGNFNQWSETHNYRDYDLFLITHDDNLILAETMLADIAAIEEPWDIITNSIGRPAGSLRGSFEFFKPLVLDLMGGMFDLSTVSLDRTGCTENSQDRIVLNDWNNIVYPLHRLILDNDLKVLPLSPTYRVSAFCIEGERGLISQSNAGDKPYEDKGLEFLHTNGII